MLVRKIVKLVEVQDTGNQSLLSQKLTQAAQQEPVVDKLTLAVDVVSAMRLLNPVNEHEPPNSYVRFRIPQLLKDVVSED